PHSRIVRAASWHQLRSRLIMIKGNRPLPRPLSTVLSRFRSLSARTPGPKRAFHRRLVHAVKLWLPAPAVKAAWKPSWGSQLSSLPAERPSVQVGPVELDCEFRNRPCESSLVL